MWIKLLLLLLLMGHDADGGVGMNAGHPQSSPPADAVVVVVVMVIVVLNREDVSGQTTDQTMRRYVMLLCVLDNTVKR